VDGERFYKGAPKKIICTLTETWPLEMSLNWMGYVANLSPAERSQKVRDALSYLIASSQKWSSYTTDSRAFSSVENLTLQIKQKPSHEAVAVITALAEWYSPGRVVGFALIRRTWCHHLAIDFLAAHPRLATPSRDIAGVATALLAAIGELARILNIEKLWLETTDESVDYYKAKFRRADLKDLLVIDRAEFIRPFAGMAEKI
jgi:hypothetical protein